MLFLIVFLGNRITLDSSWYTYVLKNVSVTYNNLLNIEVNNLAFWLRSEHQLFLSYFRSIRNILRYYQLFLNNHHQLFLGYLEYNQQFLSYICELFGITNISYFWIIWNHQLFLG